MTPIAHTPHTLNPTAPPGPLRLMLLQLLLLRLHMEPLTELAAHAVPAFAVRVADDGFVGGEGDVVGEGEPVVAGVGFVLQVGWG